MGVSDHLARIRRDTKNYLFAYLNVVLCDGNWKEVARIRKQLKEILQQEAMGFSIRSRFKENNETEKASLFHLNCENKNFLKNNLGQLKIDDKITDSKDKIEENVLKYYGALFNGQISCLGLGSFLLRAKLT